MILIVAAIVIVGVLVRSLPLVLMRSLPYQLGGLYYLFSDQIAKNDFLLPTTVPFYSNNQIQFVYPPLAFIIEAILIKYFNVNSLLIVNFLPFLFSSIGLASFALISRKFFKTWTGYFAGIFIFALIPRSFDELIEGGGLAESLGGISVIWIMYFIHRLFYEKLDYWGAVLLGLFLGLAFVSAPGSALFSSFLLLLLSLIFIFNINKISFNYILLIILMFLITSLFYINHIFRVTSPNALIAAVLSQYQINSTPSFHNLIKDIFEIFKDVFKYQINLPIIYCYLITIGAITQLFRSRYLLLFLYITVILIPRENVWLVIPLYSILFGLGVEEIYFFLNNKIINYQQIFNRKFLLFLVWILILIPGIRPVRDYLISVENFPYNSLTVLDLTAIKKLQSIMPEDGKMVVLGKDTSIEWFPVLGKRSMVNGEWGTEFQPQMNFIDKQFKQAVNSCMNIDCVNEAIEKNFSIQGNYFLIWDKGRYQDFDAKGSTVLGGKYRLLYIGIEKIH